MTASKTYRAFLSYSHRDHVIAKKLHRALENYRPPKTSKTTARHSLGPVFRDQDEMGAAPDLSDRIKTALRQSDYLIVLASPDAKASQWVNDEIRFFREMKGDSQILCALVHDDPAASFPAALLETGQEPLAANLLAKNFRLGVTQLAASMLGVGLDDLIQRDLRKMRRRVTAITVSACTALIVMGSLTWAALSARGLAEQRRQDAEGQIEFMITDLKDDLESVGRLDALDAVGQRAVDYYENYSINEHDDDALGRRARVFHMLGSVQDQQGNLETANEYFTRAFDTTTALLKSEPRNADRVFEHSQSSFWVGNSYYRIKDYEQAEIYFRSYADLIENLSDIEGETDRVRQERIYALSNLSSIFLKTDQTDRLSENLARVIDAKREYLNEDIQNPSRQMSLVKSYQDLVNFNIHEGNLKDAVANLETVISILANTSPNTRNFLMDKERLIARRSLANARLFNGDINLATQDLSLAKKLARILIETEPDNADIFFQVVQVELTAFHIAYVKHDLSAAHNHAEWIFETLSKKNKFESDDIRAVTLQAAIESLPLYIAIMEDDVENIRSTAEVLKEKTGQGLNVSPSGRPAINFLSHLLSRVALGETDNSTEFVVFCNKKNLRPTFRETSALATVFSNSDCPAAYFDKPHPTTSFRVAVNRLNSSNQE